MVVVSRWAENLVVGTKFGRAKPEVPVDIVRLRFFRQITCDRRAADADSDLFHVADAAVANELDGLAELAVEFAALLAAGLKDDFVLVDRVDDQSSLANRVRKRLFAIDVFLGSGGLQTGDRMRVIGRGDHNGVDILAGQQLAKIRVDGTAFVRAALLPIGVVPVHTALRRFAPRLLDITDGNDLDIVEASKAARVTTPLHADADHAERDAVGGDLRADSSRLASREIWNRKRGGRGRLHETAPCQHYCLHRGVFFRIGRTRCLS